MISITKNINLKKKSEYRRLKFILNTINLLKAFSPTIKMFLNLHQNF